MYQHLLRVAAVIAALVGSAMSLHATAAPHPSIRVKIVESAQELNRPAPAPQEAVTKISETVSTPSNPTTTKMTNEVVANPAKEPLKESVAANVKAVEKVEEVNLPNTPEIVVATPVSMEPVAVVWRVDVSDGNVRQALSRWSLDAGWIDHWELDMDIPLTASATLATTPDFTVAVQKLAEAVALSESPFRPCFYSNNVVRILPYNAMCDRTTARPERG